MTVTNPPEGERRKRRKRVWVLIDFPPYRLALSLLVVWVLTLLGVVKVNGDPAARPGKKGQVTFHSDVRVSDLALKAGQYTVQRRPDDSGWVVRFMERTGPTGLFTRTTLDRGETRCQVEALPAKARSTTVYLREEGEGLRVTRIEIAGENIGNLF